MKSCCQLLIKLECRIILPRLTNFLSHCKRVTIYFFKYFKARAVAGAVAVAVAVAGAVAVAQQQKFGDFGTQSGKSTKLIILREEKTGQKYYILYSNDGFLREKLYALKKKIGLIFYFLRLHFSHWMNEKKS